MRILVLGHLGNMGRRYTRILNMNCHEWTGSDLNQENSPYIDEHFDKVILATPTDTHLNLINIVHNLWPNADILCEKPFTKDLEKLSALEDLIDVSKIFMVNNYQYLFNIAETTSDRTYTNDITHYNYFKTGGDGLYWDCIQLINMASDVVSLQNTSPIWECVINGYQINYSWVDRSYIHMIHDFLFDKTFCWGYETILNAHKKTMELICQKSQ